jgi:glutamyl-tRNA synthetase
LGIDPAEGADLVAVVKAQAARAKTLVELARISAFVYRDFEDYDEAAARKHLGPAAEEPLSLLRRELDMLALEDWEPGTLEHVVHRVAEELDLAPHRPGPRHYPPAAGGGVMA